MQDPYEVLEVTSDATQEEIKNAFRERALECHPDRVDRDEKEEAAEEFLRVREAFELLSDPETKRQYDATGEVDSSSPGSRARRHRSYKEEWRKYKDQKVYVSKEVLENVSGLSSEYDLVRQKTSITVPVFSVLGAVLFLVDPLSMYGTGIFLVDGFLCGLIGSVYGFAVGSVWGYIDLFLKDLGYK